MMQLFTCAARLVDPLDVAQFSAANRRQAAVQGGSTRAPIASVGVRCDASAGDSSSSPTKAVTRSRRRRLPVIAARAAVPAIGSPWHHAVTNPTPVIVMSSPARGYHAERAQHARGGVDIGRARVKCATFLRRVRCRSTSDARSTCRPGRQLAGGVEGRALSQPPSARSASVFSSRYFTITGVTVRFLTPALPETGEPGVTARSGSAAQLGRRMLVNEVHGRTACENTLAASTALARTIVLVDCSSRLRARRPR